jgi:tRNA uridine 5-carbamoylmethylation protein Kti12
MKIILFRGRPGTGKTTLSHLFAEQTNFPILRKDDFYDPISLYVNEHRDRNKLCHEILYSVLESNKHSDATFVLDFAFQNQSDFFIIKTWCIERNVELKSILVTCSDEKLWATRFNKRAENPAPNQLITNFEGLKNHYGNMEVISEAGELVVDTVESVESLLVLVRDFTSR